MRNQIKMESAVAILTQATAINHVFDETAEELLVFPLLVSMTHNPDLIVGAANNWWARETNIPTIQGQALDAWSALFGLPVVHATNI